MTSKSFKEEHPLGRLISGAEHTMMTSACYFCVAYVDIESGCISFFIFISAKFTENSVILIFDHVVLHATMGVCSTDSVHSDERILLHSQKSANRKPSGFGRSIRIAFQLSARKLIDRIFQILIRRSIWFQRI